MGVAYSVPLCLSAVPIAVSCYTHSSSPEVGNGMSWPQPQRTCNAMVARHIAQYQRGSTILSNSACSMLISDNLRLSRRGLEPGPSRFREVGSTAIGHCPSLGRCPSLPDSAGSLHRSNLYVHQELEHINYIIDAECHNPRTSE